MARPTDATIRADLGRKKRGTHLACRTDDFSTDTLRTQSIDLSCKKIWASSYANRTQINLPVEKLSAGVYMVIIKNGTDSKMMKLVKE